MGEGEPLHITLHSVGPHWEHLQRLKLLENAFRTVWPCASLTRTLWFQLMWSDFLALLGFQMRSGNTKLSLSVNLTTLSKQISGSVWKGLCLAHQLQFCSSKICGVHSQDRWMWLHNCSSITSHIIFPAVESSATPVADIPGLAQPWFYF